MKPSEVSFSTVVPSWIVSIQSSILGLRIWEIEKLRGKGTWVSGREGKKSGITPESKHVETLCLPEDACGPAQEAQLRSMGAWLLSDTCSSSLKTDWPCPFSNLKLGNFLSLASLILFILLLDKGWNIECDFSFPKLNSQWPCLS